MEAVVLQDHKAELDLKDHKAELDLKDHKDHKARWDLKDLLVMTQLYRDLLGLQVKLDPKDPKDQLDHRAK
jgi:hypothetical protein